MANNFDPQLENDIQQILAELPSQIRALFASEKIENTAKNLMLKNRLHIDQGAILEREIILLTLGLHSPDEFADALKTDASISEDVMRSIMTDVNQEIFVPLQKQMREEASAVPQAPRVNAPVPRYAPPRPQPVMPRPTLPPSFRAVPKATQDTTPAPIIPAPLPPRMAMPNAVPATRPGHPTNLLNPKPVPSPQELPIESPPPQIPAMPVVPKMPPVAPRPAVPYSDDPYREPVDA